MARKKTQRAVRRKKDTISNTIKNEIVGIIIVGFACLGFVLLYANNENSIANTVVRLLRILAGEGSAGIFVILAAIGLGLMGKSKKNIQTRILGVFLLWLVLEGFMHLSLGNYTSAELLTLGKAGQGGGLIGAGISIFF